MADTGITNDQAEAIFNRLFAVIKGEIETSQEQFGIAKAQWSESSEHLTRQLGLAKIECDKLNEKQDPVMKYMQEFNGTRAARDKASDEAAAMHEAKLVAVQAEINKEFVSLKKQGEDTGAYVARRQLEMEAAFDQHQKNAEKMQQDTIARVTQAAAGSFNIGTPPGGFADSGGSKSLINFKNVRMPDLPEDPNSEVFKHWFGKTKEFFDMQKGWNGMLRLLDSVGHYQQLINGPDFETITTNTAYTWGTNYNGWNFGEVAAEVWGVVRLCLPKSADKIVADVPQGNGLELIRMLVQEYDPINPEITSAIKALIFGSANNKCADFPASHARMKWLLGASKDMLEKTGNPLDSDLMADVFWPAMDRVSRQEIGMKKVDHNSWKALKGFIDEKFNDEKMFIPVKLRKTDTWAPMDLSAVAAAAAAEYSAEVEVDYGSYGAEGEYWPQDNSLDAFKGKGKGKNKGGKQEWKPNPPSKGRDAQGRIICNRCTGHSHPEKLCGTPAGSTSTHKCTCCQGNGHDKAVCAAPGGGKHVPYTPGKGATQRFFGKGSGKVSDVAPGWDQQQPQMQQYPQQQQYQQQQWPQMMPQQMSSAAPAQEPWMQNQPLQQGQQQQQGPQQQQQ